MTDELGIQKQQPSAVPYAIGGGIVGGAGAYLGTNYFTKPKYGSYEDIINKMEPDTFNKELSEATGDKKTLYEAAKAVRDAKGTAESEFETKLSAFKETSNGEIAVETPAYEELKKAQDDAKAKLDAKIAELQNAKAEEIRNASKGGTVSPKAKEAIDKIKAEIEAETKKIASLDKEMNSELKNLANEKFKLVDHLQSLENKKRAAKKPDVIARLQEEIKQARKDVNAKEAEINEAISKRVESMSFTAANKSELKTLKDNKVKEMQNYISDIIAERSNNSARVGISVKELETKRNNAFKVIKEITGNDYSAKTAEELNTQVARQIKAEQLKIEKLDKLQKAFEEAVEKAKATSGEKTTEDKIIKILYGLFEKSETKTTEVSAEKYFAESLSKEELQAFNRLVKSGNADQIEEVIKASKDRIAKLEASLNDIKTVTAKVAELGGEGAYIEGGVLKDAAGKKVVFKPEQVRISSEGIEVPKSTKLAGLERQLERIEGTASVELTEEQIAERARNAVDSSLYRTEQEAFNKAKQEAENMYRGLERRPATEDEILQSFLKKENVASKEEYLSKRIESEKNSFIEKYGKQLEGKLGKGAGWKLAAITAGGLVIGGIIGSMFTPKNNA